MDEEEKKNNKGLILLLVVFIVLTILLGSYIIYDNFIKDEPKQEEKTTQSQTTTKEETDSSNDSTPNTITSINNYPTVNDNGLANYILSELIYNDSTTPGFTSKTVAINSMNFDFRCSSRIADTGEESDECSVVDVYTNNKVLVTLSLGYDGTEMIVTDDYIITQGGISGIFPGEVIIFDKQGNELKRVENTTKGYAKEVLGTMNETSIKVTNDKLYYVTYSDFTEGATVDLEFKYIDLKDNLTEHSIEKLTGIVNDQA